MMKWVEPAFEKKIWEKAYPSRSVSPVDSAKFSSVSRFSQVQFSRLAYLGRIILAGAAILGRVQLAYEVSLPNGPIKLAVIGSS